MKIIPNENNTKFRKTKIVATLGPACHSVEKMTAMLNAGLNCARFNFSHGDHAEHKSRLDMLRKAMKITGKKSALLLDTKGPEIRTGEVKDGPIIIKEGDEVIVSGLESHTHKNIVALSHKNIHLEVKKDQSIKIADGSIILKILRIEGNNIICTAIKGGTLGSKKNVNIPEAIIDLPNISEKDIADIKFAIANNYDYIAASFIRNAAAIKAIREILHAHNSHIHIIAKIENQEGLNNLESIIQISDGIMVARGDLAEQIAPELVPLMQKRIIKDCVKNKKIAITATQMLQSMEVSMTPTRAELTDVANAIFDGTDAVMLSGETAQGKYPVEAIQTMHNVAIAVETSEQFKEHAIKTFFSNEKYALLSESDAGDSVIAAAQIVADKTNASAFACPTLTGNSPKLLAALKPSQPILATTHLEYVFSRLLLVWGVKPVLIKESTTDYELINSSIEKAREVGFLKKNGKIIIIAGLPINKPLMLNTIQIFFDGTTIARGRQGCGKIYQGKFHKAANVSEILTHAEKNTESYIYCISEIKFQDLELLKNIHGLLIEQPSIVPMEVIEKELPNLVCVAHINALMFQPINNDREIVVSGNEKVIYEP